jgi:tetratricopeptide (TPR) repeat protein
MRSGVVLIAVLVCAPARADQDEDARVLYESGRVAFEQGHAQQAYDAFRKAYMISQRAALLVNMAAALEQLDRPHDAAEALRSYLRVVPDDTDRPRIELRIRALEEKQRLLDEDRRAHAPPPPPPPSLTLVVPVPPPPAPPPKPPIYKRWWLWAIVGGVAAGTAVALGVTLSSPATSYPNAATPDGRLRF